MLKSNQELIISGDLSLQVAAQFCVAMASRGEIVRRVVQESGISVSSMAQKLGISRSQLYLDFANPEMSFDRILAIGKLLHYDFSQDFKDIPPSLVHVVNGTPVPSALQLQQCQERLLTVQEQLINTLQLLDKYRTKYGSDLT